jgi:uncharacterized pyridoxamine 5'-phosphate oxidase family protein
LSGDEGEPTIAEIIKIKKDERKQWFVKKSARALLRYINKNIKVHVCGTRHKPTSAQKHRNTEKRNTAENVGHKQMAMRFPFMN